MLERLGFVSYGTAEAYLKIDGVWQDNKLLTPTPGLAEVPQ